MYKILIVNINKIKYILRFITIMTKRNYKLLLTFFGLIIFLAYFWIRFYVQEYQQYNIQWYNQSS